MRIYLNTINNNYSFKSKNISKTETPVQPTKRQITDAKVKKAASECFWVALGVCTLYFFTKRECKNIQKNGLLEQNRSIFKFAKHALEPIVPSADQINKAKKIKTN